MNKAYVLGVSMTKFATNTKMKLEELGAEAVWGALEDAGMDLKAIQGVYCGNVFRRVGIGQRIMTEAGHTGMPITNVENACASGSCALREAYFAVAQDRCDVCLALGVEIRPDRFSGPMGDETDLEGAQGLMFPALYALRARRYMFEYGLKPVHLAQIAVNNRKNAYYNEKSSFGELIDVDTVLKSRMVADPLHLYDCNPVSDGAAAAVVVNERTARRLGGKPVEIIASSLTSGSLEAGFIDMTFEGMTHRAAEEAYHQAGFGPEGIDFAEVHDCFTIAEILRVEGLGFCERGGMIPWIEDGTIAISGKKPINPSGGLIGKGHPLGATGIAQIYEICKQVRGEAGKRQIQGARVGLAMNRGGVTPGIEGNACTIHILRAPQKWT